MSSFSLADVGSWLTVKTHFKDGRLFWILSTNNKNQYRIDPFAHNSKWIHIQCWGYWNICVFDKIYSLDWCLGCIGYVWSVSCACISYLLTYGNSWFTHHSVGGCVWWLVMRKVMMMCKDGQTKQQKKQSFKSRKSDNETIFSSNLSVYLLITCKYCINSLILKNEGPLICMET